MFVLACRNLKDKRITLEKKYSAYDSIKNNLAVVIYAHNNIIIIILNKFDIIGISEPGILKYFIALYKK